MKRNIFLVILSSFLLVGLSYGQIRSGAYSETHIPADGFISIFGAHSFNYMKTEKGIIHTQRGEHKSALIFAESGSWSAASQEGYVDGFVKSYKNDQFVYPVGDQGQYRPILLKNSREVSVAFVRDNPNETISNRLDKINGLESVNDIEYWTVHGDNPSLITLSWDGGSDIFGWVGDDLSKLTIAGYDGAEWKVIPSKVDESIFDFSRSEGLITSRGSSTNRGTISSTNEVDLSTISHFAIGVLNDAFTDQALSLSVFPNPAVENNYVYVDYAFGSDKGGKVIVKSMDDYSVRQQVLEGKTGKLKLSTDDMKGGVYWVIIEDDRGRKQYTKLILVDSGRIR